MHTHDNTCSTPGCLRTAKARGLCGAHYQRRRNTGDVQADVPVRHKYGEAIREEAQRRRAAGPIGIGLKAPDAPLRGGIEMLYDPGWAAHWPEGIYPSADGLRRWYVWVADDAWSEPKLSRPFPTLAAARRYLRERLNGRPLIDGDHPKCKFLPRHSEEVRNLPPGAYLDVDRQVYIAVFGKQPGSDKGSMAVVVETSEIARMLAALADKGAHAAAEAVRNRDREVAREVVRNLLWDDDELTHLIEVSHDAAASLSQGMTAEEWEARHAAEMAERRARHYA